MSDKVNFFVPDLSSPAIVANKSGGWEGVHQHLHQPRHRAKLLFVFAQRETTYHIILGADLVGGWGRHGRFIRDSSHAVYLKSVIHNLQSIHAESL